MNTELTKIILQQGSLTVFTIDDGYGPLYYWLDCVLEKSHVGPFKYLYDCQRNYDQSCQMHHLLKSYETELAPDNIVYVDFVNKKRISSPK